MKIYKNQTNLQFTFSTGADLTNQTLTTLEIKYPGGSTTSWTCTVSDASTGAFYYNNFSTNSLRTIGIYYIQPKVVFHDDTIAYGESRDFRVYDLWT